MSLQFAKALVVVVVVIVVCLFKFSSAENSNLIQPFIVNGTDAKIEDFPFMVSVRLKGSHNCGGTILNDFWILTAAHCVAFLDVSDISVQYGLTVISNNEGLNIIPAQQLVRHEKYAPSNQYKNDIGLVKLKYPLNITLKGYRVKLPVLGAHFETGTPVEMSGWGTNSTNGPAFMATLQRVDLQVFSASDCAKLHDKSIHFTNICAGVPGGYKSQCYGDSGGPILARDDIQVGIVSWSVKPCGVPPFPGVLTAVAYYTDWIAHHTGIDFQLNLSLQLP